MESNADVCPLQNPRGNYRVYREALADLSPPYIPLTQLLLKGNAAVKDKDKRQHLCFKRTASFI